MDRVKLQNVNIVTKAVPASVASSSLNAGGSSNTPTFQIGSLPPIPRWVGVAVVAATTALGAAGCYYYFYSKTQPSPKKTGSGPSSDASSGQKLKDLGNEYFKKNDYANALDCYSKAIQAADRTPEQLAVLYQNRAAVFEKLGDKLQVINESTCALKYQPNYFKALIRRAKAYKETGFLDEAFQDITTACTTSDQFQNASTAQLIEELVKEMGVREARKVFKNLQPSEPSPQFVIANLRSFHDDPVTTAWAGGKSNESQLNHNSTNGDDSSVPESGYALAIDQLRSNKFSNIIQLCTDEINNPESPHKLDAYLLRGTFRHLFGYKDREVVEDFKMILENSNATDELRRSAWIKTGISLFNTSWDTVEDTWQEPFEKAAKLHPSSPDAYYHWGQHLLVKGEIVEAINKLTQAVDCCPSFPLPEATRAFLKYKIALIHESGAEMGQSFVEFENLQKKWPDCIEVFSYYGQLLMEMQRFEDALKALEKVIALDPENTNAIVHGVLCKGRIQAGYGDLNYDALAKELHNCSKIDPKNALIWETIATMEVQLRNKEAAAAALEKAVECSKTFPEIAMLYSLKFGSTLQLTVTEKQFNTT